MEFEPFERIVTNLGRLERRRRTRVCRFQLSTLLGAVTAVCVLCLPVMWLVRQLLGAAAWRTPLLWTHLRAEDAVDVVPWLCGAVAAAGTALAAAAVFALPARGSFLCLCMLVGMSPLLWTVGAGIGGPPEGKALAQVAASEYCAVQLMHLGVGLPLGALCGWWGRDALRY